LTVKLCATNKSPLIETSLVTNKLPPTVALPLADTVDNVVAPVTPRVPAIAMLVSNLALVTASS
jgi:hypothetical protein